MPEIHENRMVIKVMGTEIDGIQTGNYLDELECRVPVHRLTLAARQRIAYKDAEMEDRNGKLRGKSNTAGRQHCL